CILCVKDSIAEEKHQMLKSLEAEVVLCPAGVDPEHPESYYSKALELSETIPNAFYINQNFNPLNKQAHYETTGPEIWSQSKGRVTHLIASCSTGGTLSGTGRFLKEQNPLVKVYGVDTEGSVLKPFHEQGTYDKATIGSSKISGVGKNIITDNVDFELIDSFIRVDVKGSTRLTKQLIKDEGIWAGHSSGAVLQALFDISDSLTKDDFVVLIFPDHGSRYVHKLYNNGLDH
ncbi:MAG: cysteine synthase family protein, partial [Saprospiraceae bacterium]|nr:cysteine synthase family protein [Saprospiraceae bacterium]